MPADRSQQVLARRRDFGLASLVGQFVFDNMRRIDPEIVYRGKLFHLDVVGRADKNVVLPKPIAQQPNQLDASVAPDSRF